MGGGKGVGEVERDTPVKYVWIVGDWPSEEEWKWGV